ncbi:SpaA isopeptide-forming pilin-related protein [Bifidobacterium adolescentis]|uniref:SpaA isopeptide-forming pilin-related protein n=1 Tax=Bifidobacterium adolescentis TaxID=1680 RepID=UPI004062FC74
MNNTAGPNGSYAAEAEGLTAVNGKLLLHPLKGVWATYYTDTDGALNGRVKDYRGFRFGIVGFGGQYRPKDGSSALEVKGASSDNDISWVGGAQAWGNAGWIGKNSDKEPSYKAHISGAGTTVYGGSSNPVPSNGSSNPKRYDYTRQSVYDPFSGGSVSWNQKVDKIGSTNETFDSFKSYISKLSTDLSSLKNSGSVYAANAQDATNSGTYSSQFNNLKRSKYNGKYTFKIQYVNEKVILFKGDGKSSMQVFNLPASMLNNSSSYSGVSFAFENIPDSSSVVINVTGDGAQNITFHNGWRFWWTDMNNNKSELGGSYIDPDYAKRAQQIMWNFPQTQNLTIQGGQGTGPITIKQISAAESAQGVWGESTRDTDTNAVTTTDDPAAGLLGSVLVPNGSFESHVSTNGRVWVGNDFSMYNPTAVGVSNALFVNVERSHSASALDMDQERHNLPWNGSYSTQCAAIAWDKVDASTQAALGGTTWTVYASKSDAQNQSNALKTVTDNAYGDDDSNNGSFSIGGLNPNAIYYIREVSANNTAYATNTNIYAITAGGEGSTARVVTNVYDSEGNEITDSNKKLLPSAGDNSINAKIANKRSGTSIEWSKVDGTDTETLLGGSAWTLSKMNGNTTEQSWNIIDDQSGTEVKSVKIFDANSSEVTSASFTGSAAQRFHAVAYDQNGKVINNAKLTWESADPAVASVNAGLVTATGDGDTTITVKSADGSASATLSVHVKGVIAQTSVNIKDHNNGDIVSLEKGKTLQLTATVAPEDNTVKWSSSDPNAVSLNTTTGTSVTLTANSVTATPVTITAKETRGNKTFTLSVTVTAKQYLTLYFEAVNNWPTNNVTVGYGTSSGGWSTRVMQQVPGCADSYAYVDIPPADITADSTFLFLHTNNDGQYYYPPANYGGPKAWDNTGRHYNFKFVDNGALPEAVTISAGPNYSITAPSGCAVTQSASNAKAAKSTKRAVATSLRTNARVTSAAANTATATKADEDTAAGRFKVSDLADGTYHLQETVAPNGYEVSDTVYTITIANGVATWNPASDGYKLPNTRKTGTVKWNKVSSEHNDEMLSGAEWKLTKTKSFSWDNGTAKYTTVTDPTPQTIKDCVNDESDIPNCSAQSGQYVDLNGEKGKFELQGLAWGEYQLVETKAPDGFNLDTTPHTFRIGPAEDSDVTGEWYTSSGFKTDSTDAYNANTAFTVDGGSITNTPGVVLPGTGGEGLNKMYTAGFLAVAIAVAGLALSLRRRQS